VAKQLTPGSPAAVYLAHQANVLEAELDGGSQRDPSQLEKRGEGYQLCNDGNCIDYTNFEVNPSGELVNFSVKGAPVDALLTQGNGQAVKSRGTRFTFLTSYKSQQSNALFVAFKTQTGAQKIDLNMYTATYRDPTGKQRTATSGGGPVELGAHSNAIAYSAFLGVKPGGVMTVEGCVGDCTTQYKVRLRVR
jgi:hypothetical protein